MTLAVFDVLTGKTVYASRVFPPDPIFPPNPGYPPDPVYPPDPIHQHRVARAATGLFGVTGGQAIRVSVLSAGDVGVFGMGTGVTVLL